MTRRFRGIGDAGDSFLHRGVQRFLEGGVVEITTTLELAAGSPGEKVKETSKPSARVIPTATSPRTPAKDSAGRRLASFPYLRRWTGTAPVGA